MANRYWVGGTATWDTTVGTKWATTTGGAGGASVPTAADDVFFDAASGAVTCTVAADSTSVNCRSLNFTGFTGIFSHPANSTVNIGDGTAGASNIALLMPATMTYSVVSGSNSIMLFKSTSVTQQTIQCKPGAIMGAITIDGTGSSYILSNNGFLQTLSGVFTLTRGTFNSNNFNFTTGSFSSSNSNARTLTLGTSTWTINGGVAQAPRSWNTETNTNLTYTANTATVALTVVSGACYMYTGSTKNTNGMSVTRTNGTWLLVGTPTFANLTCTSIAGLSMSGNPTITGTLTLSGSNSTTGRLYVSPDQFGANYTFTAANIAFSNVDLEGCRAAGAANWDISAITGLSGDAGNNTGITFTPAETQTWSGTSGGSWSTNAWTTRVPLPQDDVVISSAFTASQTITANMARLGNNIDFTGSTGNPIFSASGGVYGALTLIPGMTVSGASGMTLYNNSAGATTRSFNQNGATITNSGTWNFRCSNALSTYEVTSTINMPNATFAFNKGIFNTNDNTFNVANFGLISSNTATVNMGTSTINVSGTAPINVTNTAGGFVYNGLDATINILSGTGAKTFAGANKSFGIVNYVVSGSTGSLTITGSNSFKQLNFRDANNARTLRFTAGTTTTITDAFNVRGTAGKLMTITSATAATHTITDTSNSIDLDYVDLSYSTGVGVNGLYAGANSTNSGNNTNWYFNQRPSGSFLAFMDYV
jgi:hypothetical protein